MADPNFLGVQEKDFRTSQKSLQGHVQDFNPDEEIQTTPLHYAAGTGNYEELLACLQPGVVEQYDIDVPDTYGRTALVYTILADHVECTELILSVGASIDATDGDGRTALHWAAFHGKHKMMKYLISQGANGLQQDNEGRTPLHLSTGTDSSKCTKLICKKLPPEAINQPDSEGMTAAHWCAFHDHAKHLDLLINMGADLLAQDNEGRIPLHWTENNQTTTTCQLILAYSYEAINEKDKEGHTPLHLAVAANNHELVNMLAGTEGCDLSSPDNMKRTPLHWAAVLGHHDAATVLLQYGADSASADDNGATPLHYAAINDDPTCIAAILQFPQEGDHHDEEGRTPMMWAAGKGCYEALVYMLQSNFDVLAIDSTGATAMHAAAFAGQNDCVKALIQSNAAVDALDTQNHTPLFRACEAGQAEVVITLLEYGASIDLADVDGRTALHWSALGGYEYICLQLVKAGCQIDSKDKQGRTALQCAAYGGHIDCMSVFLENGADVNSHDHEGITSLHWASAAGRLDAAKLLFEYGVSPNPLEVDGDKLTPLDYATIGDAEGNIHDDVANYLVEKGGLSIVSIREMAAIVLQSWYRGNRCRMVLAGWKPRPKRLSSNSSKRKTGKGNKSKSPAKQSTELKQRPLSTVKESKDEPEAPQARPLSAAEAERKRRAQKKKERELKEKQERDAERERIRQEQDMQNSKVQSVLLTSKNLKHLARRERKRLGNLRVKVKAAMVIQLAWRRYARRMAEHPELRNQTRRKINKKSTSTSNGTTTTRGNTRPRRGGRRSPQKKSSYGQTRTAHAPIVRSVGADQAGSTEWKRQIAALTIQLAYRQYLRKKLLSKASSNRRVNRAWAPSVLAERQRRRVTKIYTRQMKPKAYKPPRASPMIRPQYMKSQPSAAVRSFNFAVDSYHFDRDYNHRASKSPTKRAMGVV